MTAPVESPSIPPHTARSGFSLWLDLFRWLAAFDVLWGHVSYRYLQRYLDVPPGERSLLHLVFAFPGGFIHFAVMVFFVLSGYLVGGSLLAEARPAGRINLATYLVKRTSRLSIVLLPALMLTWALDRLALWVYPGSASLIFADRVPATLGLSTFLCNGLYLQTTFCWEYGYNVAFWSLANEFWYYVAWPLFVLAIFGSLALRTRIASLACGGILLAFLSYRQFDGASIGAYMLVWMLGCYAAAARRPLFGMPLWLSITALLTYAIAFRVMVRHAELLGTWQTLAADLVLSLLFANMLIAMKLKKDLREPPGAALHKKLAGFSYSLYATHEPILNCFVAMTMARFNMGWKMAPHGLGSWAIVAGGMALAIGGAYLFSLVSEAHTPGIRRRLLQAFNLSYVAQRPAE